MNNQAHDTACAPDQSLDIVVTVVMPVYNTRIGLVSRAVSSLRAQTTRHWELVIVDDGSDAAVASAVDRLALLDSRISVVHQENLGVSAARNSGILAARGAYIAFLDADDELTPSFLDEALGVAAETSAEIVFGAIEIRRRSGISTWRSDGPSATQSLIASTEMRRTAVISALTHSLNRGTETDILSVTNVVSALYSTTLAGSVRFPENVGHAEDRIFNARAIIAATGPVAFCSNRWYVYDQTHDDGVTRKATAATLIAISHTVREYAALASVGVGASWDNEISRAAALGMFKYLKVLFGVAGMIRRADSTVEMLRALVEEERVRNAMRMVNPRTITDVLFAIVVKSRCVSGALRLGHAWAIRGGLGMKFDDTVEGEG